MKSLLIVTFFLVAVCSIRADVVDMYLANVKDEVLACGKENGFTEQTPREIYDKDVSLETPSCMRACVQKKLGLMKDSKIIPANMNEYISKVHADHPNMIPGIQKFAADCIKEVESTTEECKMSFDFVTCFLNKH